LNARQEWILLLDEIQGYRSEEQPACRKSEYRDTGPSVGERQRGNDEALDGNTDQVDLA
jgi:hypothetical protein